MGVSIEVTKESFALEVLQKSYFKTVLVDFYAVWCGPCQLLKPRLEAITGEYDLVLAKVDIDKNPELAHQYGVEGVPDVRIVSKGEILPGFVGVVSDADLHDLLRRLNLKSNIEIVLEEVETAKAVGDWQKVKGFFDRLFAQYPDDPRVIWSAANFLLRLGKLPEALKILGTLPTDNKEFSSKVTGLKTLIALTDSGGSDESLDSLLDEGAKKALQEDYQEALNLFLDVVRKDKRYREEAGRKAMIGVFNLLGSAHPLTKHFQEELTLILF